MFCFVAASKKQKKQKNKNFLLGAKKVKLFALFPPGLGSWILLIYEISPGSGSWILLIYKIFSSLGSWILFLYEISQDLAPGFCETKQRLRDLKKQKQNVYNCHIDISYSNCDVYSYCLAFTLTLFCLLCCCHSRIARSRALRALSLAAGRCAASI